MFVLKIPYFYRKATSHKLEYTSIYYIFSFLFMLFANMNKIKHLFRLKKTSVKIYYIVRCQFQVTVMIQEGSNIIKFDIEQYERFPTLTKPLTDCHCVFKTSKENDLSNMLFVKFSN